MMKKILYSTILIVMIFSTTLPNSAKAALDVATAKAQELVGEKPDGLLGIVTDSPSIELQELVKKINSTRLEKYKKIAMSNGISVKDVQAIAGSKLIKEAPKGQWVMINGRWVKK